MGREDSRATLWSNVQTLMRHRYGGENLTRLAKDCKFSPATSSRLKTMETSVTLETMNKLADFFGVEPWQLLVPGMSATSPPVLRSISPAERELYERLLLTATELARNAGGGGSSG